MKLSHLALSVALAATFIGVRDSATFDSLVEFVKTTINGEAEASVELSSLPTPSGKMPRNVIAEFREVVPSKPLLPVADAITTSATDPVVDESALRYFASRGDNVRLQAEISRLRALYPNWVPPKDPLAVPQNADTQLEGMWKLYSEARYAEVRKAIAARQVAETNWRPPADLIERLDVAEARLRLINASDLKQYEAVVTIGSETPSLLTCSEVDVLWRVAEAFFRTDRPERSTDAYTYILNNCTNTAERLATVQKASAILPAPAIEELLAKGKVLDNGIGEFDSLRDDLARRFVADANSDEKKTVPPTYVERLEKVAETGGLASDALLLGWYHYLHKNIPSAEQWFRRSRDKEDTASASEGLALTLIERKDYLAAEDAMYRWRDASKEAKAVYLAATANLLGVEPPLPITGEVLRRIAPEVIKSRDPATAQQFGWYARALNQPQTAIQWFRTALGWKLDDEPSAYGLAVTYQQINDIKNLAEIQRLWAGRSQRIARVGQPETEAERAARLKELGLVPLTSGKPLAQQPVAQQQVQPQAQPERSVVAGQTAYVDYRETPRRTVVAAPQATTVQRGCRTTIDPRTLHPNSALNRGWLQPCTNHYRSSCGCFTTELSLRGHS
ncbi:tetratricopeptide (TPR) repeat protein [Pararhizobium capsulatum DSM 1112]|uniref:Tetratricopeptide (TPR) repeat protein n=1 Tax=Pararhizobium capsulatum DSM 1112 TaxID=1121113 RepID=A0ABU0BXP7_9HYPH|nr:cellulose synthase [Pararhizobium capsulatum]MDQ0322416.1 tetratricopeptide (TPR) repeat protein [Pararhizobium capsulatum DSM 1112]